MTISELMDRLREFPPEMEIMILDGFNGGGHPRDLNCGPKPYVITEDDEINVGECDSRVDEEVVVIGYGCY